MGPPVVRASEMVSGGKWPKLHPCQGLVQEDSALFPRFCVGVGGGVGGGQPLCLSLDYETTTAGPVLGKA